MKLKALKNMEPWQWPESAGELILETLVNRQAKPADRILAAELAGDLTVINEKFADALLEIVGSGDEPVKLRCPAAISLGPALEDADTVGFDDPEEAALPEPVVRRIRESFHRLFSDAGLPKEVRRSVLEASVRMPEEWHAEAVRSAYSGKDPRWRLTAVFAMRFIEGFEEEIIEALGSRDPDTLYEAVCAAREWGIDGAWPRITQLLAYGNADKFTLIAAIEAAAAIRPDEAPDVIGNYADSDDDDISEATLDVLSELDQTAGWDDSEEDEEE
ncbi:MAG: hypothetical protein ABIG68_14420 [Acidobacteriota bacterium]